MYPSDGQGVSQSLGRQLLYLDRASVGLFPLLHARGTHRHVGGGVGNVNAKRDETGVQSKLGSTFLRRQGASTKDLVTTRRGNRILSVAIYHHSPESSVTG